jgi:hypothetical protein
MTTIANKTPRAIAVPLPRGKKLHLGPGKTGQIAANDSEHPPFKKLVEAGEIETGELAGYEVTTRFYEIGSPAGLEETIAQARVQVLQALIGRPDGREFFGMMFRRKLLDQFKIASANRRVAIARANFIHALSPLWIFNGATASSQ